LTWNGVPLYDAHGQMRILYALLAAAVVFVSGLKVRAELVTGIEAVVHDSIITYQEVEFITAPVADELRRKYQGQPEVYQQKLAGALHENLQFLMNQQLILREFERAGYKIPESIIDQSVQERIRSKFGDRVTFTKTLQAQGMTFEQFRKQVRNQIIIGAMQHNFVSEAPIISPQKIQIYYAEHQEQFQVGDQVKLRMIVLNKPINDDNGQTKGMAGEVLAQINEGAAFDQMASVYSQGSQAGQGGELGWAETKILRPELLKVASALNLGGHSGVVEASDGYYIMLLEDKQAAHVKPLKEVRAEIEKNIAADERAKLEKQWIEKLKNKTFVRTY
jgi:peptidyl-prolyl cis-trans isomerase SurA